MSDSTNQPSQNKPWYKQWWGILIVICILPYFFIWYIWSKTHWNKFAKVAGTAGLAIVALIGIIVMVSISSDHSTQSTQAATAPSTSKPQTPTTSLAALKAQALPILTAATDDQSTLMKNIQAAAAQPNAGTSTSTFHQFWDDMEHSVKYDTSHASLLKVDTLYSNANQTTPDGASTWEADSGQVYTDIQSWTNDQQLVFADTATNNDQSVNQAKVNADSKAYETDLAKTRADINQL